MAGYFQNLPAAVYLRLLCFLDSPGDLFAAATSCRPVLAAFRAEEGKILAQVLVNSFGVNLHDAVCLVTAPAFDAQDGDHRPRDTFIVRESIWSGKVKRFRAKVFPPTSTHQSVWRQTAISNFFGEQLGPGGFNRDVIFRLCKLATMVDGCMSQYMQFFRAMATTHVAIRCHPVVGRGRSSATAADESDFLAGPSPSERHRIQRAMIRFEMVCRLFTIPFWKMLMATSADKTTPHLAEFGRHDYNVERFLGLIDRNEVEQLLSVAAFVRAQYRCMLGDMRRDFEEVCRAAADELAAATTPAVKNAVMWYYNYRLTRNEAVKDKTSVEYLLHNGEFEDLVAGRDSSAGSGSDSGEGGVMAEGAKVAEQSGVAAGIANIASGFGLGLMGKLLGMGKEARRKQLMDIITAVDQGTKTPETDAGYPFDYLHVQSFPVVENDQPAAGFELESEEDGPEACLANGRLVGYWFWDDRRLETEEFELLYQNWLIAKSPVRPVGYAAGKSVAAQLAGWYGQQPNAILGEWWITEAQWWVITEDFRVWKYKENEGDRYFDRRRVKLLRAIINKSLGTGDEDSQN